MVLSDPVLYAVINQIYLATNLVKSLSHLPLNINSQLHIDTVYGGFFLVSEGHHTKTQNIYLSIYLYEKKSRRNVAGGMPIFPPREHSLGGA